MKYKIPLRSIDTVAAIWLLGFRNYEEYPLNERTAHFHCPYCGGNAWMRTGGSHKNIMHCTECLNVMDIVTLAMEVRGLDLKGVKRFLHPANTKKAE